jgi:hypothetical protein
VKYRAMVVQSYSSALRNPDSGDRLVFRPGRCTPFLRVPGTARPGVCMEPEPLQAPWKLKESLLLEPQP